MFSAILTFFKNIGNLIAIVKAILALIEEFRRVKEAQRQAEQQEKKQKREEAVDQQVDAQTEEEFDRAQDTIVDNKP